ncbi:MAG: enoyl-CoA hydratase/isomerase family protein [Actinobacteria bacterium]|nr:enoyl-CoA hydratase/isomerase family protein [Actinomycetota bacterium]
MNDVHDDRYDPYEHIRFERRANGVLHLRLDRPDVLNATDEVLHRELSVVWRDIDADPAVRVAVIDGAGRGFSAGGDLDMIERMTTDPVLRTRVMAEALDLVRNLIDCSKPVVSAVHGPAVGAGLVAALLADVSVVAEDATLIDGHTRLGVAAGDHAVLLWPLLCGMAKAKYHLLLCEPMSGARAEQLGMVSLSVPRDDVLPTAFDIADRLATGAQEAIRLTKRALNGWLTQAWPLFEASWNYESSGFAGEDVREGVASHREKRPPVF